MAATPAQQQGSVVAGIVVNSVTGQPLPGITVSLAPDSGHGSAQTVRTSANGHFSFSPLAKGKYILSGNGPGYRSQGLNQHEYFFTGVAVGPELDTSNIVFRLQPDASIRGQVLDEQNEPVRNATAQLFKIDDSEGVRKVVTATNAGTDDLGYYHFPHLAPGTYYVGVSARPWYARYEPQHMPHSQQHLDADTVARVQEDAAQLDIAYPLTFYPDADDSSQASAMTLRAGDHAAADIVMRAVPGSRLSIRSDSLTQRGAPPRLMQRVFEGLLIPVFSSQGFGYSQRVYEFAGLAPGHYAIEIPAANPEDGGNRKGWFRDVDLYGNLKISASDSPTMATVTGLVSFQGALPSREGAYIELRNLDSSDSWTTQVSNKGLFGLKDNELRPGTYELFLYNSSDWFVTSITAQNAKVRGSQITLAPGAAARIVCTATRAAGNVSGTVLHDEKPVAGAMVLLVPDDATHQTQRYRRDQSDSDGTFSLRQVLPGNYTLLAIQNGWDLEWGNPDALKPYLASGQRITVSTTPGSTFKVRAQ
jgi:uncharacterized GH25 family protein